ncbi:MAG: DUF3037 domain-containing protein [Janthinobacterium lividum]
MSQPTPYSYVLLRYRHDPISEEFVNVAAVLLQPSSGFLNIRLRTAYARVLTMFPMQDRAASLKNNLSFFARKIRVYARDNKDRLTSTQRSLDSVLLDMFPKDDGAFQWSALSVGITADPKTALDRLYARFVSKYDTKHVQRRTDDDVWRAFRHKLDERSLSEVLKEKTIRSSTDELDFKLAWKNGKWHCFQPLSFDLSDKDGIRDKARRWTGHLTAIADASDAFIPYFVLAAPKEQRLQSEFEHAISILRKSPVEPVIYLEENSDDLVADIAKDIEAHKAATGVV